MMSHVMPHLPVLLIILPLLAAVLCFLIKPKKVLWLFTILVTLCQLSLSTALYLIVFQDIFISYELGNWPAPWGIELAVDYLNVFLLIIISFIAFLCACYFDITVTNEISIQKSNLFYCAFLLNLAGLTGVLLTGDAFNLFVFIEISAISSYALVTMGQHKRALLSAFDYLVLGTIGATFTLIGLGFLYVMTGTLNMGDLADRIPAVADTGTVWVALCFVVVGLFIKLALFPLHTWLSGVYVYSPNIITVYFSATTTKVFIYVLIRYLFTIFDHQHIIDSVLPVIFITLSCFAILYGAVKAIQASTLKYIFAYSSISQIGYMVLGVGLFDQAGMMASMLFMLNHAVIKAGIFLAISIFLLRFSSDYLNELPDLKQYFPVSYVLFILLCLALIGIPGTAGFVSKWYLVSAVIQREMWLVLAVILLGSLFSVIYIWKIIETVSFSDVSEHTDKTVLENAKTPFIAITILMVLTVVNFYLGLNGGYFINSASTIADFLVPK